MKDDDPVQHDADDPTTESGRVNLRGKLLLASATMADDRFTKTVILIVRHDDDGALGLVVNRPLGVSLDEACSDEVEAARGVDVPLFHGGPCSGPLVAVHNVAALAREEAELLGEDAGPTFGAGGPGEGGGEDDDEKEPWAEAVTPGVWFCARREALEALMRHTRQSLEAAETGDDASAPPVAVKFVAGYAGWGAGQLEGELAEGSWLVAEASMADVYAGGSPHYPAPAPTTSLPPGAIGLVAVLAQAIEGGHDPTPGLAAGIRQWVRLSTRANLSRMIDPRLIPNDPSAN